MLFHPQAPNEQISYTKANHAEWHKETQLDQRAAIAASRVILRLVELMLVAAARPGVQKASQTFHALVQAIEKVKDELRLENHIDAELRDRHSTETNKYTVRELRDNSLLAKSLNFKDDPALNDDETLTLTKAAGWLPAKEIFNAMWQQRELMQEIAKTDGELTEGQETRLTEASKEFQKSVDNEIAKFVPSDGTSK